MKAFVVVISGLLLATPALAQPSGGTMSGSGAGLSERTDLPESTGPGANANANAPNGEHLVCRRVETGSTSRMSSRRVCRTAAEWRDSQRDH